MKNKDITALSTEELQDRVKSLKKELFSLKIANKVSPITNPLKIQKIRRTIARLKTAETIRLNNIIVK